MKIKKSELKQIIQEELEQTLLEEGLAYRIFNALENFYVDIKDKIKGVSDEDPRRAYALKRREADKFCTKVARISDLHGDAHNKCTAQILDDWKREEEGETSEERSARKMAAMRADLEAERDAEEAAEAAAAAQADADTLKLPRMTRRQARRSAERPYGGGRVGGDDDYTAPTPSATTDTGPGSAAAMQQIFGACTKWCDPGSHSYNRTQCNKCKGRRTRGLSTRGEDYRRDTSHYYPSESINKTDLYGIVLEELEAVIAERNK